MPARELSMAEAINEAIRHEMRRDANIVLLGQDIGPYGGTFGVYKGLFDEFGPERVRDGPLSEAATTGVAIGLAISGMPAIVEIECPPKGAGGPKLDRARILAGKVAVVTGAASGLGRATSRLMSELGASVVVLSLKRHEVETVVKEIQSEGGKAHGLVADVSDVSTPSRMIQSAVEAFGRLDVLVNNAAYFERQEILKMPESAGRK